MSKTNKIILSILIIIVISLLVLLSKKSNTNSKNRFIIGASESLTGSAAYYGESSKKGIDLAIDWLKEKYPDIVFDIYHEDNQFNPKIAVDSYSNLINLHSIDAIITQNSPSTIAIQPLAKKDGILQMGISASAINYTSSDDLSFRMTGNALLEAMPMVSYINSKFKKVVFIYMNNEIGLSASTAVQDGIKKEGKVTILSSDSFDVASNDFRTLLIKIKSMNPDALYVAGLTSHITVILKQMKELGINTQVLTFRTGDDQTLIDNAKELSEGIIFTSNFDDKSISPEVSDFTKRFENKYGIRPNSYAAEGYEGAKFVGKAFEKCGKNYDCIKTYLTGIKNEPTLFGDISFDNNGDIYYNFFLKTIKNGRFVRLNE